MFVKSSQFKIAVHWIKNLLVCLEIFQSRHHTLYELENKGEIPAGLSTRNVEDKPVHPCGVMCSSSLVVQLALVELLMLQQHDLIILIVLSNWEKHGRKDKKSKKNTLSDKHCIFLYKILQPLEHFKLPWRIFCWGNCSLPSSVACFKKYH